MTVDGIDDLEAKLAAEMSANAAGPESDEATRNLDPNAFAAAEAERQARESTAAAEAERLKAEEAARAAAAGEKTEDEKAAEAEAARIEAERVAAEEAEAARKADEEKGPPKRKRLEALSEDDRYRISAAVDLAAADKISFEEAYARLKGTPESRAQAGNEGGQDDPLAKMEAEMEDVRGKIKTRVDDRELPSNELDALQERREELRLAIREEKQRREAAKIREERQAVEKEGEDYDRIWAEGTTYAEKAYPEHFGKGDSPLHKAVIAELSKIRDNPKHLLNGDPEVLKLVYDAEALKRGIIPKDEKATTPPVKKEEQTSRLLPAGGGTRQIPANPGSNEAQAKAALESRRAEAVKTKNIDELMRINEMELTGKEENEVSRMRLTTA